MDAMRFIPAAWALLTAGLLAAAPAFAGEDGMSPVSINGYQIMDAEYLPFVGLARVRYPDDVLWGFYPEDATAAAEDCAHRSYDKLTALFQANPPLLKQLDQLGGATRFYLWINDYSLSGVREEYRSGRLWHTNYGASDYHLGAWNWETTLYRDGTCETPSDAQVKDALGTAVRALSDAH